MDEGFFNDSDEDIVLDKDLLDKDKLYEEECLKYLHIAASKNHLEAIKKLGEISYNKNETNKALHYYLIAEKNGISDTKVMESIAFLYYNMNNYRESVSYCEKANTAGSDYLLGRIFEQGMGCPINKEKALEYYKKAMNADYTEAQVAFEKLNAKIEEDKKKKVIEENKNYSASSSTSGYSTSYSGW